MTTTDDDRARVERLNTEWADALARLTDEDRRLLALLRVHGGAVDPRYETKGIRLLVSRALVDPELRRRALADADAVLEELRGHVELPDGVHVRCVENTADTLTVLLPAATSAMDERSRTIRDVVFSRTQDETVKAAVGVDDDDISPLHFDLFSGDHDGAVWGDRSHDGH